MSEENPTTYDEFWPYYARAHAKPATRKFHFAGTTALLASAAAAVMTRKPSMVLGGVVTVYTLAWISHFFIEGNKPASFGHPLWSIRGDFEMYMRILDGTMDAEVELHTGARKRTESPTESAVVVNTPPAPAGTLH